MENEYTYELAKTAKADLDDILDYIATDLAAADSAIALLNEIENALTRACAFPKQHSVIHDPLYGRLELRKIVVKNYLLIYQIREEQKTLYVVHVVYGASDYIKRL